jgi:hypothetical protein
VRAFRQSDCPSGKVSYPHKKHAQRAVQALHRYHQFGKRWRAYRCHLCDGWHLTTQPTRKPVSVGR